MESSTELFCAHGYHNTHVMQIVSHAGVSAGTFYKHFDDKRAVYVALVTEIADDLRRQVQRIRSEALTAPFEDQVGHFTKAFQVFFEGIAARRAGYLVLLRGGFGVDERSDTFVWQIIEGFTTDVAEDLERAAQLGLLEHADFSNVARAVTGMCLHIAHAVASTGSPTPEGAANVATRFLLGGLMGLASEALWTRWTMNDFQRLLRQRTFARAQEEE
jgi:AcrR family transcriptional regulator